MGTKTLSNHLLKDKAELKRQKSRGGNREKNPFKRVWNSDKGRMYLLSFLLPVLSMLIVFAGNKIWPFGDRCFLRTDLYHQYAPFYAELLRKLKQGGSLYYSWNVGLGTNFLALFGYYTSSIFNVLLILCPESLIIEYVSYMVVLKIGLAGITFSMLLYRRNPKWMNIIPLVSLFYAMSGYVAAYSWNVMWMDCIWLAPLILLGIEKLMLEKKPLLYIISLSLAILSNYYIGIMLCIFCVLYFFVEVPELLGKYQGWKAKLKNFIFTGFRFAFASLLCGGLAAIILIPEVKMLGLTASADTTFPTKWNTYFNILDMLGRHMMNVDIENGLDHWPNIYCGVAAIICIPMYLLNKRISLGSRIMKSLLAVFMLFSFSSNVMSYIWHGFHYPNSLPSRQSFLYIALLLTMCYEGLQSLHRISLKVLPFIGVGASAAVLVVSRLVTDDAFQNLCGWATLAFVVAYSCIMFLYRTSLLVPRKILLYVVMALVFAEATINMAVTSVTTVDREDYTKFTAPYQELITAVQETDPSFYRFEKVARKTKNDGAFVGYPSLSIFSSVSYDAVSEFLGDVGCENSTNAYCNNGITPLINSILGVKYILTTAAQTESELMTELLTNDKCYVYENTYTMSVGFMIPYGMTDIWEPEIEDAIEAQNEFSELCGGNQLFYMLYDEEEGNTVSLNVTKYCHVFVEVDSNDVDDIEATVGEESMSFSKTKRDYLLDLGFCSPEDVITLTAEEAEALHVTAYYLDEDAYIELITLLQKQQMEVTSWDDTHVEGTITVTEGGTFFLSIPYDPGWTLYVDGKATDTEAFKESFLSCELEEGTHTISLTYTPEGLKTGALITLGALLVLVGYTWLIHRKR